MLLNAIEQSDSKEAESILQLILDIPDAEPQVQPWSNKHGSSVPLLLKDALSQRSIADHVFVIAIAARLIDKCKSKERWPWECQLTDFIMHSVCSTARGLYTSSLMGATREVVNYLANNCSDETTRLEHWLRAFVGMQPLEHPEYWLALLHGRQEIAPTIAEALATYHPERAFALMGEMRYDETIVDAIDNLMWYFVETHGIRYVESRLLSIYLRNAPRHVCQQLYGCLSELGLTVQLEPSPPSIDPKRLTNADVVNKRTSILKTFSFDQSRGVGQAIGVARDYDAMATLEAATVLADLNLDQGKYRFEMTEELGAIFFSEPLFWIANDVFSIVMASNGSLFLTISMVDYYQEWHRLLALFENYVQSHRVEPFRQTIFRDSLKDRFPIRRARNPKPSKILETAK
jgi:hypothetical protein